MAPLGYAAPGPLRHPGPPSTVRGAGAGPGAPELGLGRRRTAAEAPAGRPPSSRPAPGRSRQRTFTTRVIVGGIAARTHRPAVSGRLSPSSVPRRATSRTGPVRDPPLRRPRRRSPHRRTPRGHPAEALRPLTVASVNDRPRSGPPATMASRARRHGLPAVRAPVPTGGHPPLRCRPGADRAPPRPPGRRPGRSGRPARPAGRGSTPARYRCQSGTGSQPGSSSVRSRHAAGGVPDSPAAITPPTTAQVVSTSPPAWAVVQNARS